MMGLTGPRGRSTTGRFGLLRCAAAGTAKLATMTATTNHIAAFPNLHFIGNSPSFFERRAHRPDCIGTPLRGLITAGPVPPHAILRDFLDGCTRPLKIIAGNCLLRALTGDNES